MSSAARLYLVPLVAAVGLTGGAAQGTPLFSIDTVSVTPLSDSHILSPGPTIEITDGALGILVPGVVDLDSLTYGAPADIMFFSVDRTSVGVPGPGPDVFSEAAVGQAAGDIYITALGGTNALFINQAALGLVPPLAPGVPALPPIDNLDALDLVHPEPHPLLPAPVPGVAPPWFTLTAGNVFGVSGADILAAGVPLAGPPVPLIFSGALGLVPTDDIDALHFDPVTGLWYFSLTPTSPSLGAGVCGGFSAADIFVSPLGGVCGLFAGAPLLGLLPSDNVDALAFVGVPEPGTLLYFGSGVVSLALYLRRRPRGALDPTHAS